MKPLTDRQSTLFDKRQRETHRAPVHENSGSATYSAISAWELWQCHIFCDFCMGTVAVPHIPRVVYEKGGSATHPAYTG